MAKKKSEPKAVFSRSAEPIPTASTPFVFPELSPKTELECKVLLEDQILVIDARRRPSLPGLSSGIKNETNQEYLLLQNFFSRAECKAYVKFIDSLPLELTPPKKRGEAVRVNHRYSVTSLDFAQKLHKLLTPHLPSFPYPALSKRSNTDAFRKPHSFNSNIRLYKYTPSQHFGPHYDDSVRDPLTGVKSEWTLLIYLTGVEDGVEGGQTLFYKEERGKPRQIISAPLTRGTALLHRHGPECMLHEGSTVEKGTKYVLRSDIMFMQ